MTEPKPEKPYKLETISKPWSETDVETWWLTLQDFIKSVPKFKKSMQSDKIQYISSTLSYIHAYIHTCIHILSIK